MLESIKSSLAVVCRHRPAFETQLRRVLPALSTAERRDLKRWCFWLYGECYYTVICQCFAEFNLSMLL
jgi:hypothetical protein